ncbi:MAG: antibiotic biosynthesis monooxygenase [Bacteroidales bacterium]|jgi:hypothetical protein|nr:antibiotic biosynthesis monooxygenase [Bacteroidales bacterium]
MKNNVITELLKIEVLPETTPEQLLEKADVINSFISQQEGFIDSELVRAVEGNTWYFIYHIENMEKLKAVGEKIRSLRLFGDLMPLIESDSMKVSFYQKLKSW